MSPQRMAGVLHNRIAWLTAQLELMTLPGNKREPMHDEKVAIRTALELLNVFDQEALDRMHARARTRLAARLAPTSVSNASPPSSAVAELPGDAAAQHGTPKDGQRP